MTSESKTKELKDQRQRPILVVEDNPADVFVIREVLKQCNLAAEVHVAQDGHEALLYLKRSRVENEQCPALVILDLNLPKIPGFEVLSYLKQSSDCKTTPAIVVTSSSAKLDRETAQRLGAEAYFQKPSNITLYMKLAEVIEQVLRKDAS